MTDEAVTIEGGDFTGVRVSCDRCGVFWDGGFAEAADVWAVVALHYGDSCHPSDV